LSTRVASRHLGSQWVIRREREREVKVGACIDNRPFEMCFDVSSGNTSGNLLGGIFFWLLLKHEKLSALWIRSLWSLVTILLLPIDTPNK
jgi:hypothetical protein